MVGVTIADSTPAAAPAEAAIGVYDFGRPAALSREHTRVLELAFEQFSRLWAAQLSGRIGVRTHVSVESVGLSTYGEYAESLPATTTMVVCAPGESDERIIVQFPLSAAISWITQMVGGRPASCPADRALTPIEQALIRTLTADAVENLTGALGGLLPAGMTVAGIQYSSQFAQVAAAGDPVIVARLSMLMGEQTVEASVMLPASVVLEGLSSQGAARAEAPSPGLVRRLVEQTPVPLALRLVPRSVHAHDVLSLAVGDVIPFPHAADRPLDLVIGDHVVARAAVGASGARRACVIAATALEPAPAEESP